MKNSFLNRTLKGTKFYIVLTLILSAIYSRLLVYIPMFIQYALDGIIMEDESVIPILIRKLFFIVMFIKSINLSYFGFLGLNFPSLLTK